MSEVQPATVASGRIIQVLTLPSTDRLREYSLSVMQDFVASNVMLQLRGPSSLDFRGPWRGAPEVPERWFAQVSWSFDQGSEIYVEALRALDDFVVEDNFEVGSGNFYLIDIGVSRSILCSALRFEHLTDLFLRHLQKVMQEGMNILATSQTPNVSTLTYGTSLKDSDGVPFMVWAAVQET